MHRVELKYTWNNENIISKIFHIFVTKEISEQAQHSWIQENDEKQKKKNISKIFSQNFLVLKYDGLRISGKAPLWSRIEIYIWDDKIGEANADEKGKYRFVTKNLAAGEYSFSTKIILASLEEIFLPEFKNYTLKQESRSFWFIPKKTKSKKKSASTSSLKIPELIITASAAWNNVEETIVLSFRKKMVLIFFIVMCLIFAALHMIFLQSSSLRKSLNLDIFTIAYNTRQKVLLTL